MKTQTLIQNLLAYCASEVAAKASRMLVVVAIARYLDVAEIGYVAAAIAIADILNAFTENGVVQRIIAAPEKDLRKTCNSAHCIFWIWCVALFMVQTSMALVLYLAGADAFFACLLVMLACEYLFMPGGIVQVALAMRAGKMRQTAAISGAQVVGANILTAILAVVWASPLALIAPRMIMAPFWLVAVRRLQFWRAKPDAGFEPVRPFIRFGWAVMATELVKMLRLQADKLIVGAMMGPEILGMYFMAFNAGLSLANAVSAALMSVVFPHLTGAQDKSYALRQTLFVPLMIITPVVLLQAISAPYYVPILLGDDWTQISAVVSILCLVAIPMMIWAIVASWHRAHNAPEKELWVMLVLTLALLANVALLQGYGLQVVAIGYAILTAVILMGASAPTIATLFNSQPARI